MLQRLKLPFHCRAHLRRALLPGILTLLIAGLFMPVQARTFSVEPAKADQVTSFARAVDALLDSPDFRTARWGVVLADLDTTAIHYSRDMEKSFMPASNLKLFTSAAGLALLGPDFRSTTTLATTASLSEEGVLQGDLLIHGTGDPSISGRYNRRWRSPGSREPGTPEPVPAEFTTTGILTRWARSLSAYGIRKISGSVVALRSGFGSPRAGSWQLDYYPAWYAAEGSGVAMNENCFDLRILPGAVGEPARIERVIVPGHIEVVYTVMTTSASANPNPEDDASISVDRELDGQKITITGTIPENSGPISRWGSVHDGDLFSASLLTEVLKDSGIEVAGAPRTSPDAELPADAWLLFRYQGENLARNLVIINKPSQNFYADQLLRMLGRFYGRSGTFREGEQVVRDYLTSAGMTREEASTARLVDGSGLSRQNAVTPAMILTVLRDMAARPTFNVFLASLPVAGRDGTIGNRLRNSPVEGHVHAKTGTINGVRCLSGYILMPGKRRLAFVLMANNFAVSTDRVNQVFDQFLILASSLD
jgi:D-alanyl-D-alanine carboxypeptidase/D-alanyl-D-alanine-endopeptidase (penicillin-binding protein 4)